MAFGSAVWLLGIFAVGMGGKARCRLSPAGRPGRANRSLSDGGIKGATIGGLSAGRLPELDDRENILMDSSLNVSASLS